jgi:plastocyanin
VKPLALGVVLAGVLAAPAQADTVTIAASDALVWDKPEVSINPGDSVTWTFAGTTQFHNVWAASPNWTDESTLGAPAPDYTRMFDTAGDYAFICRVHPDTMRGVVHVGTGAAAPVPTPLPLSQQPLANDTPADPPAETAVTMDKVKPRLSKPSVRRASRGATVRFKVSEDAVVDVAFARGKRTTKTYEVTGDGSLSVRARGLRRGRYTVKLVAVDIAGNKSKSRTLHVTVR